MAAILDNGTLRLTGYVGEYYYSDSFDSAAVVLALAQIDENSDLDVHINSGGGDATEGAAIHAILSGRRGTTNVVVEGIAASAASLIAMAGETVTMSAGSVMMIHDPSGFTFGTSSEHTKTMNALEALATAYARVYAMKSGKTPDECRTLMKEELWLHPDKAVEEGFADATTETKADPVAAFDYRLYANAPKRLNALARKNDWREPEPAKRSALPTARHDETKETTMSETTNEAAIDAAKAEGGKTAVAAYQARRKSVMAMEEAKGREALAEHLIDSEMSEDQIKATLAVSPKAGAGTPDFAAYEALRGKPPQGQAGGPLQKREAKAIDRNKIFATRRQAK